MKKILFLSTVLLLGNVTDCYAGPWEIAVTKVQAGKADWDSFTASGEYRKAHGALNSSRKTGDIIAGLTEAYDNWKSSSFLSTPSRSVFSGTSTPRSRADSMVSGVSFFSPSSASVLTFNPEIEKLEEAVEKWDMEIEKLEEADEDVNTTEIKKLREQKKEARARIKELKRSGGGSSAGAGGGSAVPAPAPVDSPYSVKGQDNKIYSVPKDTDLEKKIRAGMAEKSVKEVLAMVKVGSPLGLLSLETAGIKVTVTDASTAPVVHGAPSVPTVVEIGEYELLKGFVTIEMPRGMDMGKVSSGIAFRRQTKLSDIKTALAESFNQGAEEEAYTEAKKIAEAVVRELQTKGTTAKVKAKDLVILPSFIFIDPAQKDTLVDGEPASSTLERLSRNRNPNPTVAQGLIDRLKTNGIEIQLNPDVFPLVREGFAVRSVAPLATQITVNGSLMTVRAALSKITKTNVTLASYIEALEGAGIRIELPAGLTMEELKKQAEAIAEEEAKKAQVERERKAKAVLEAAKKEFASNKAELGSDINTYDLPADTPITLSGSENLGEIIAAIALGKKSTDPVVASLYVRNKEAAQAAIDKYRAEHS